MIAWVIATIAVMVVLAIAFAVFTARADRNRVQNTQRWWSRKHPGPGPDDRPPVG